MLMAIGLVAGTAWTVATDPARRQVATLGRWLAFAGAVATLGAALLWTRGDTTNRDGPLVEVFIRESGVARCSAEGTRT